MRVDEHVLGNLVEIVRVAGETGDETEDAFLVVTHELREGAFVAVEGRGDPGRDVGFGNEGGGVVCRAGVGGHREPAW